ncbi:MAG: gluconate 2-dehydrogenase subunit 3 family protein [Acidobacteria bacterium]|nr:gluconate 2-dehydrogenase subunit 3 family protein [Acidobacteriota bacterium]
MKKRAQIHETHQPEKQRGINRREMVQRLVGGAAGGLVVPAVAAAHPAHPLFMDHAAASKQGAEAPTANWNSAVLDQHQIETLSALAERIVPGSTKAGVAPFVDLLLSVETLENQQAFLASLSAIDGESRRRYNFPFKELTEDRQNELLKIVSAVARSQSTGDESSSPSEAASQPVLSLSVLNKHFENLKSWVSKVYYSSEVGRKELGWTGSYVWPTFPGCERPRS